MIVGPLFPPTLGDTVYVGEHGYGQVVGVAGCMTYVQTECGCEVECGPIHLLSPPHGTPRYAMGAAGRA